MEDGEIISNSTVVEKGGLLEFLCVATTFGVTLVLVDPQTAHLLCASVFLPTNKNCYTTYRFVVRSLCPRNE